MRRLFLSFIFILGQPSSISLSLKEDPLVICLENYAGIQLTYTPFVKSLLHVLKQLGDLHNQGKIENPPTVILYQVNDTSIEYSERCQMSRQYEPIQAAALSITKPVNPTNQRTTSVTAPSTDPSQFPNCSRTLGGPSPHTPCIFPFKINSKVFHHCTRYNDFNAPGQELWCSTMTDSQGHHLEGMRHWGYCDPECDYFIFLANMIFDQATENTPCAYEDCIQYSKCSSFVDKMHEIQSTFNTSSVYALSRRVCSKSGYRVCCNEVTWIKNEEKKHRIEESIKATTSSALSSSPSELRNILEPLVLSENDTERVSIKDTEDGKWLPSQEKRECSRDISFITGFIVRGRDTYLGEFPHAALLGYYSSESNRTLYNCGGTLINRRYILTAAHCHNASKESSSISEVLVGEWDVGQDPDCTSCHPVQRFKIQNKDVIQHELWDPNSYIAHGNDVALIRLPEAVTTFVEDRDALVLPACLDWKAFGARPDNDEGETRRQKKEYIVTGWGRTTPKEGISEDYESLGVFKRRLVRASMVFVERAQCLEYRTYRRGLAPNHVCFLGENDSDSCGGDSGSAIVKIVSSDTQMVVQSIVSFGTKKCGIGTPGVYTNIRDYIPWIIQNLRE